MRDYLAEIKQKTPKELKQLSCDLREEIIDAVSKNGGHLASNLGMVEATIALHKVFNSPNDKIIFDVGHQSYAHKIITGRDLSSLRKFGGVSGFPNRQESEHDILNEGHSGTSISAALGIAEANRLNGSDDCVVAVIGDGSLTNGLAYEALNNCGGKDLNLVVLVNDNEMSINKNVGALTKYLSNIRVSRSYFRFKRHTKAGLKILGFIGKPFMKLFAFFKNTFRRLALNSTVFEDLGLEYIGPVDGNNLPKMVSVLNEAKMRHVPVVVHMRTVKGYGYDHAEKDPSKYHGVCPFNKEVGAEVIHGEGFSNHAGKTLLELAKKDEKICAITAAMADGTGLSEFEKEIPERFFDVGIAEEHAVTFASGLAVSGKKPVLALYSTFAQRCFDEALHDIAIQKLPLTVLLDRCGLVSGDGITHQGIFDYPMFSAVPQATIYAPKTYGELDTVLEKSLGEGDGLNVIRYPRGNEEKAPLSLDYNEENMAFCTPNIRSAKGVIITYGRLTTLASEVASELGLAVLSLLKIFPLNKDYLKELLDGKELIYVLDEGYISGGFGEKIAASLSGTKNIYVHAINDFVEHGSLDDLNKLCGFTKESILERIKKKL